VKVKKVEKYWIHRPEVKDDNTQSTTQAKEWFKYAFQVIRDELREKKRQTFDFASIMEKLIDMERYIHLYKASHKLIIAPWIHKLDCEKDLTEMEEKMSLDDIICCREIAFTELITEGKTYCSSGEFGVGYKPLIHLWEYYVNDLRSKWINKSESKTQIELSNKEKRDLMILSNLDRDKVLLSYIKGEQNHPEDQLLHMKINIKCLIITFSRKVNSNDEVTTNIRFYKDIFNKKLKEEFRRTHIAQIANSIPYDDIKHILNEENKVDSDNEEEVQNFTHHPKASLIMSNNQLNFKQKKVTADAFLFSQNYSQNMNTVVVEKESNNGSIERTLQSNSPSNKMVGAIHSHPKTRVQEQLLDDSDSVNYMDKFNEEESKRNSIPKKFTYKDIISHNQTGGQRNKKSSFNRSGSLVTNKAIAYRKSIFSIVIGHINYSHVSRRNSKLDLDVEIISLDVIDHNLSYVLLNNCNKHKINVVNNNFEEIKDDQLTCSFYNLYYDKFFTDSRDLVRNSLSSFLIESLNSYINKNKSIFSELYGLSEDFESAEFKFISDYFYKYGLKKYIKLLS
jgi:hypothetical protein